MASQKSGTLLRWHYQDPYASSSTSKQIFSCNKHWLIVNKKKHWKLCIGYDWLVVNAFIAKCKASAKSVKR